LSILALLALLTFLSFLAVLTLAALTLPLPAFALRVLLKFSQARHLLLTALPLLPHQFA